MGSINSNSPAFDDTLKRLRVMADLMPEDEVRDTLKKRVDIECEYQYALDDGTQLPGESTREPLVGHPALTATQSNELAALLGLVAVWSFEQSKYKGT